MVDNLTIKMKKKWEDLHSKERFQPKYPTDHLVRFVFTHFPLDLKRRSRLRILDLGCGAGVGTVFLAKEGFQTYATDISDNGLKITKKRLKNNNLKAILENANMEKQPFDDAFFDGVIVYGVFSYNTMDGYQKAVDDLYRILKKGGKGFVFTRTTSDYRFGKGRKIGKNTFILNTKESNEAGIAQCFLDRKDINRIFSKFKEVIIEKTETTFSNQARKNSDWIIEIEK